MADGPEPTFIDANLYKLPNDQTEHNRLERMGAALYTLMHNRHIHAQLQNPTSILDIGCGTGFVTRALAAAHPTARTTGIDLSPVPNLPSPGNTHYQQGDIRALAGTPALPFSSFDLVFSRLLVCGMTRWRSYVGLCAALAAPGGAVELQDLPYALYRSSVSGGHVRAEEGVAWLPACRAAAAEQGMDWECGLHFAQWMREAGLVDVEVREYKWPLGAWLGGETVPAGRHIVEEVPRVWWHLVRRVLEGRESEERIRELQENCRDTAVETEGVYGRWFAVVGRKPE